MIGALGGLLAAVLVVVATSTLGSGVSPDSAAYLSAAESVVAGRGYVKFDGELYAHLPPLYPTVLAAGAVLGLQPPTVARLVNAAVFGFLVVATYVLVGLHVRSRWIVAGGVCAVVLSPTLLTISTMVWTEPLFTLLLVLVAVGLRRDRLERGTGGLVIATMCAALACLQRYAGLFVVAGAVIVIVLDGERFPRFAARARRALVFALGALVPVGLWVARNVYLTTSTSFPLYPLGLGPMQALSAGADALTGWVLPPRGPLALRVLCVAAVVAAGFFLGRMTGPRVADGEAWTARLRVPLVLMVVYVAFISGALLTIHYEAGRLVAPMHVWVLVAGLIALEELLCRLRRAGRRGAAAAAVIVATSMVWLGYQGSRVVRDIALDVAHGVGPYRRVFQRSATVDWVRAATLEGPLYSNAPEVIYLFAGKAARHGVVPSAGPAGVAASGPRYFVWFERAPANGVPSPDELGRVVTLTHVAKLADGGVYRLGPAGGARVDRTR